MIDTSGEASTEPPDTFGPNHEGMLICENIVKRYGTFTALDGVSMEVPAGKVFGLLGPNGAGKTTLIRIITRITGPDEGRVLLECRREALALGKAFSVHQLPARLRDLAGLYGVGELLPAAAA